MERAMRVDCGVVTRWVTVLALGLLAVGAWRGPAAQAQGSKDLWAEAFPKEWHFYNKGPAPIAGRAAPELRVGAWHNEGGKSLRELRGKPVVIDFWGTWCKPCRDAAPHFTALAEKYEGKAHFLAVCNTNGGGTMVQVANQVGMRVPTAMDTSDQTRRAYGVALWPYYVFIDSEGIVRAAGIRTDKVEDAVKALIETDAKLGRGSDAGGDGAGEEGLGGLVVKDDWLEDGDRPVKRRRLEALEGKAAPDLDVTGWMNSEALGKDDLKGKIVVVDFWGTWCSDSAAAVPKMNALHEEYKDKGVVIVGVCHRRQMSKMGDFVSENGVAFPVAVDAKGATVRAFRANDTPDYYVINRAGTLVVADVADGKVGEVVDALLALDPEDFEVEPSTEPDGDEREATPAKRVRRPGE